MVKYIQLSSGSVITRRSGGGYDEIWDIENKAISITTVTLDLSQWYGCIIEGHEGSLTATESAGPLESKQLFYIKRNPPFKFAVKISAVEEPVSLDKQDEILKDVKDELSTQLEKMQDFIQWIPFEVMDTCDITEKVKEFGFDHFIDPSFPPNDLSIFSKLGSEKYPLKEKPIWKRPTEFIDGAPVLFDDIDPNDIHQGALGDWWFLAAVASIAENPALVRRLFLTKTYNPEGVYRLRICKNGEWIDVIVDDYIPCYFNGGPIFTRGNGNELWVLLLEKAYAKLHGDYWQLRSGFVYHAMNDITGWPTSHFSFPKNRHEYDEIEDFADDLWDKLWKADKKGFIMCASTPGVDRYTEFGGPNADKGIVSGHAYSVISAKQYQDVRLLMVRNPWGEFEWGGAWSDHSKEWTQEYIDAFKPEFDEKDGTFWISYQDFFKYFNSITIWKVANFNEWRLKGKFIRVWEEEDPDEDWVISKFYYSFRLEEQSRIDIGLHQEDERALGADRRRHVDLQIIILKRHANGTLTLEHISESETERDCETMVDLGPGHYIVIPRTCGATLSVPRNPEPPTDPTIEFEGHKLMHWNYASTFNDLFRKVDLQLNGQLSANELNQFGVLLGNDSMQELQEEDLESEKFESISWDRNGVTQYGLTQIMSEFSQDALHENLSKMGYDDSLYSSKSKVFTITFHTLSKLRVRIGDAAKTDLNERAWDLMMHHYNDKFGATGAIQNDHCIIFRKSLNKSYSISYGCINKTDDYIEVRFKQDRSQNMLYTPTKGTVRTTVPPKSLVFMASAILDPGNRSYSFRYSFSSKIL